MRVRGVGRLGGLRMTRGWLPASRLSGPVLLGTQWLSGESFARRRQQSPSKRPRSGHRSLTTGELRAPGAPGRSEQQRAGVPVAGGPTRPLGGVVGCRCGSRAAPLPRLSGGGAGPGLPYRGCPEVAARARRRVSDRERGLGNRVDNPRRDRCVMDRPRVRSRLPAPGDAGPQGGKGLPGPQARVATGRRGVARGWQGLATGATSARRRASHEDPTGSAGVPPSGRKILASSGSPGRCGKPYGNRRWPPWGPMTPRAGR